jgi:hypothetical protein
MQKNRPQPQGKPTAGAIDIEPIVARVRQDIPPNLQAIYDKAILSGMRIMFDKNSHKMMLEELDKPGPLATRISNGIIQLAYLLWKQSNHTLPPQIMVPITLTLTLRAFQFLQESKDPEATKEVLGEATHQAVQGVMDRFGATEDKLPALVKGQGAASQPGAPAAGAPQQGGGMLDSAMGGR